MADALAVRAPGAGLRDTGVWIGVTMMLAGAFARAVCRSEPFPWWDADPFSFAPPLVGLTPAWALFANGLVMLGAGVCVVCGRRGLGVAGSGLFAIGLAAIGWHALRNFETVSPGADMAAGVSVIAGMWVACATPGVRSVVIGVSLGFGAMLAAIGIEQVFVEHPRTMESFESTKDAFYQARGWEPGGPEALMYEERLSHADPTGAFGLTNVFATFVGAAFVGLAVCACSRGWSIAGRAAMCIGALLSGWALLATGSKGGIGSAVLGGAVVLAVSRVRPAWVGRAVVLCAVTVILTVAARGMIGAAIDEKSLLFRAQYQAGAMSVLAEHPAAGVGPGRFQDAYTRLKPAGAVEDVSSTHSVWLDWLAMLGAGGLGLAAFSVLGWLGPAEQEEADPGGSPTARDRVRISSGVVACAVLAALFATRSAIGIERALAMLVGGLVWVLIAGWISACGHEHGARLRIAGIAAGAVAMVHGQLDVTGMWPVSAPAWGVLVGCGIGCFRGVGPAGPAGSRAVAAGGIAMLLGLLVWKGTAVARWGSALHEAAFWPARLTQARTELQVARPGDLPRLAERVGSLIGRPIRADRDTIGGVLDRVAWETQDRAAEGLREALDVRPTHLGTRSALGRVLVTLSAREAERRPDVSVGWLDEAIALAEEGTAVSGDEVGAWVWLGRVLERRGGLEASMGGDAGPWLRRAGLAWEAGDALSPQDPGSAARLAELYEGLNETGLARSWAEEALERDDRMRLDPRRGLSRDRRDRLEALAGR